MTRYERDECMRYVGQLECLLTLINPVEGEYEEDTADIINLIRDIANNLECLAKGWDRFDVTKALAKENLETAGKPAEGGDGDDV